MGNRQSAIGNRGGRNNVTQRTWMYWLAGAALAAGVGLSAAQAGSIWGKGASNRRAITSDETARRAGDVLTIVINEHSVIENQRDRTLDKTVARGAAVKVPFGELGQLVKKLSQDVSVTANNKMDGKADYGSDRSVTDKITVTVEDVLPNGNMVVVGRRERMMAGDKEVVMISGIVRPSDISFTNEVSSNRVADFHVVYRNEGQENGYTEPGWFTRVLNLIDPW